MTAPELTVVCKSCGSEVSPYVTECPYCGTRLRKRAPKLERVGDEVRVREERDRPPPAQGRRAARALRPAPRGEPRPAARPVVTVVALLAPAVLLIVERATNLSVDDLGAIVGPVGDEWWRYLAAPFVYDDIGYLFACGVAIAIFLPALERRMGTFADAAAGARLRCARDARRRRARLARSATASLVAAGGNGIALGALAAWLVLRDAERRADPTEDYDRIAVAVAAPCSCCCRWSRTTPPSGPGGRRPRRRRLRARAALGGARAGPGG